MRARETEYGLAAGPAISVAKTETLLAGGPGTGAAAGAVALKRLKITAEKRPDLILWAFERDIKKTLGVLPGESWTVHRRMRASRRFPPRATTER